MLEREWQQEQQQAQGQEQENLIMNEIPSQLRWSCRRGMLELDVLLRNFLEEAYLDLSSTDQALFVQLLKTNDQDLFEWLLQKNHPDTPELSRIVDKIIQHARNRH